MPETLTESIEIPLGVARDLVLSNVPLSTLKLLLVVESARPRGRRQAVIPAKRAQALTGLRPRDLFGALPRLESLRTTWLGAGDAGEDLAVEPFDGVPKSYMDGDQQRLLLPFSTAWQVAADADPRSVALPVAELQAIGQRGALLMRLRAGAALLAGKGRMRVEAADLDLLSGCGKGVAPAVHWGAYIEPALADLETSAPSVHVELELTRFTANHRVRRVVLMAKPCTTRRARAA